MSFQQGLSGLSAAALNLQVVGNNIANASTVGAKSSRAEFADLYAEAGGGDRSSGIGASLAAVTQDHSQGGITTTGRTMDLAINGPGYFLIRSADAVAADSGSSAPLYTRNGQFKNDRDGWIVTNEGARLLGYPADESGNIQTGQLQEMQVPNPRIDQRTTSEITLGVNLNAAALVQAAAFDPEDGDSFNYSTSIRTFDLQGSSVEVSTYFRKTTANEWEVFATANGTQVGAAAVGTVEFDADGSTPTFTPDPLVLSAADLETAANTGAATGIAYDFGSTATPAGTGITLNLASFTQQAGDYAVSEFEQDGYPVGLINGFSFDERGVLTARYTNGESVQTGQLAIANFRNPQGLRPQGGNSWAEGPNVGLRTLDTPGTGNLGAIVPGALEDSNVDLTAELVNLITAQRAYQANAQTIKTQDQLTQTFLNMR